VKVVETFFAVEVADMARATAFYTAALGATTSFATPAWTSMHLAGVRIGLALVPDHAAQHNGLHCAVDDLAAACAAIEAAGGRVATAATEVAPGVVIALVTDTEANTFTLTQR
jgi:predicted enzyme related to lactoylglutathione lyase